MHLKSGGLKFCNHARGAEHKEAFHLGIVHADMVDSGHRRGVNLINAGLDAELAEFLLILGDAACGVIGEE